MFTGSAHDWETVAAVNGLKVRVTPEWKGPGTALLVWSSPSDMPLPSLVMRNVEKMVADFAPAGTIYTSVSVG